MRSVENRLLLKPTTWGTFACAVGHSGLAYAGSANAARVVSMLSSRAFWVAVAVGFGSLYSLYDSRKRQRNAKRLMQGRNTSAPDPKPTAETPSWQLVHAGIERELGCLLPKLRRDDQVAALLKWAEVRSLITHLEQELDIDLPDTAYVRKLRVGALVDLVETRIARQARAL